MSQLKANCPNCAAPIEFKSGSTIVLVCPFCRSAIARTDRKLEDLGKVAEIVQSKSPLKLGLRGEFNGNKFELTGRAQIKHGAGGFWDEWYATFSNGWVGWLAEAQGKFYMTFYKLTPEGFQIPTYEQIQPGQRIEGLSDETHLIVNEKGTAEYIAAEGEIPYQLNPNENVKYVDLVGKHRVFATIDYSTNPPYLFYGKEQTLKDLGLSDKHSAERERKKVSVSSGNCPNCGGAIELKLPDKSERIVCSFCDSLLDIKENNLEFLKVQDKSISRTFYLPIGAKGAFKDFADGAEFEIIGAICRSVKYDITYYWDEYLLYNPQVGFRWLVNSEDHWNFVEPISAADVQSDDNKVGYKNDDFYIFASADAKVEYVKGEFYWRVEQGETVKMADFVAPPYMISREISPNEINWSLGTYIDRELVEKAFGRGNLPSSYGVAPNQPYKYNALIRNSLVILSLFFLIGAVFVSFNRDRNADKPRSTFYTEILKLPPLDSAESKVVGYSSSFNLMVNDYTSVKTEAYVGYAEVLNLDLELIPADSQTKEKINPNTVKLEKNQSFESFVLNEKDGKKIFPKYISHTAPVRQAGHYRVKINGNWNKWKEPVYLQITIRQYRRDNNSYLYIYILLLFIFSAVPLIMFFNKTSFESIRWKESDFPENRPTFIDFIGDIFTGR